MKIFEKDLTKLSTVRTKSWGKYYCEPKNINELKYAIQFLKNKNLKYIILGNGSNILFSKKLYDDILFIKLSGEFNYFSYDKKTIDIGAAYSLKVAGKKLVQYGYKEYIFFNLIPATIGGAITQNAGTKYDGEIKDVCKSVKLYDIDNDKIVEILCEDFMFSYRNSLVKKKSNKYIVLSAKFKTTNPDKNPNHLLELMKYKNKEKINREPSGYSFGSTFENNSLPAWKCVKSIHESLNINNGAFFSDKHFNWIINHSADGEIILDLIKKAQIEVHEKLKINLKCEVKII